MINQVKSGTWVNTSQTTSAAKQNAATDASSLKTAKTDSLEISSAYNDAMVTSSDKTDEASYIERLKAQSEQTVENLRRLIQSLIAKQGQNANTSLSNLNNFIGIDQETIDNAKQAISEDGDFGVKAVSERIANFAISLAGGDESKLTELKGAIDKGFEEARKAFGGKLPSICDDTYDAIMKKLDKWSQDYAASNVNAAAN